MSPPTRSQVVFLSSVRRGLEEERDNLPALIRAIGHECIRFEDLTAEPIPSREACLRGVDQADVYLLLLGPSYGEPLPGSGLSPTEEEFTRARQHGIPVLVFVKQALEVEPRQQAFIGRVEEDTGGRLRASFTSAADLQPKVASALAGSSPKPAALVSIPLSSTVRAELSVPWVDAPAAGIAMLECHALPLGASRLPAASLEALGDRLAELGRIHGLFRTDEALDVTGDAESVAVSSANRRGPRAGLAVNRDTTVSMWTELERDAPGDTVEAAELADRIARMLRLAAELVPAGGDVALAAGLGSPFGREPHVRTDPEDGVPATALAEGSQELGRELAARILRQLRATRR